MAYSFKHGDRPIDGYTIQRAVGRGGFGEVYYAVSDGGREVALKYLHNNAQIELRGVSNCINLKSPHLVAIFDVKKTVDGEYGIIMEYCSGPSLRDLLIAEPKGFAPEKAAFFMREIAKGLSYLHDRGIVHRDLKPGNIFYDDGYVKIGDYGLSKFISVSRHSGQTASVGTVHYMAPEIGSGNYSKGVDIYALGVMLYEMLLGRVPFEGSSMAEILMKHLTTQPELDALPEPFGDVIRKALQKDPKDRYQSVDEMVNDILDVDAVKQSLAGFSTKSLDGAVHRGSPGAYESPMPSPNPARGFAGAVPPGPPFAKPIGTDFEISKRLGKRIDRVARKMNAKLAKLGHPAPQRNAPPPPPAYQPAGRSDQSGGSVPVGSVNRRRRMLLSGVLSIALALGLGMLVGINFGEEEGAAASMLVVAMSLAILGSRGAVSWFGVVNGPQWAQKMIRLCCGAPLLAIGALPLLTGNSIESDGGLAIWIALLLLTTVKNWEATMDRASTGELRFGSALLIGALALGITAAIAGILDVGPVEGWMVIGAGVACAASIIIQATAWWLPARAAQQFGGPDEYTPPQRPAAGPVDPEEVAMQAGRTVQEQVATTPAVDPQPSDSNASQDPPRPRLRWGVTRAFWGLVAFALTGGAIVTFLTSLLARDMAYHDLTAVIVTCTGCASFMIFALRKTTPFKRDGFWRETFRPFLISLSMFAIGGTITGIAREWTHESFSHWLECDVICLADEGRIALVSGLVLSSLGFVTLGLSTGRKPRSPKPFLIGPGAAVARGVSPPDEAHARPDQPSDSVVG